MISISLFVCSAMQYTFSSSLSLLIKCLIYCIHRLVTRLRLDRSKVTNRIHHHCFMKSQSIYSISTLDSLAGTCFIPKFMMKAAIFLAPKQYLCQGGLRLLQGPCCTPGLRLSPALCSGCDVHTDAASTTQPQMGTHCSSY